MIYRRVMARFIHNYTTKSLKSDSPTNIFTILVESRKGMRALGASLAPYTMPTDVLCLIGEVGSGKTCFASGFIPTRTGKLDTLVSSPTYLIDNTYETEDKIIIHHMDLYRLKSIEDCKKSVDLQDIYSNGISLIEWPEVLGETIPDSRLEINFFHILNESKENSKNDTNNKRIIKICSYGDNFASRILDWQLNLD